MTTLHAGAKFGGHTYQVSGGLHGVGASVVNALSSWLKVNVKRDGKLYQQEYKQGIPQGAVTEIDEATDTGNNSTIKMNINNPLIPDFPFKRSQYTILPFDENNFTKFNLKYQLNYVIRPCYSCYSASL